MTRLNIMDNPVQVFLVYSKRSELISRVAGLSGFLSASSARDIILTSSNLYDLNNDKHVGELTVTTTSIGSIVPGVVNNLYQTQINIFDQLIIPNSSSGAITINGTVNRPVKHITQDWFGRKVVIEDKDDNIDETQVLKISVYAEEYTTGTSV